MTLTIESPELWDYPVDGAGLLAELEAVFLRHIALPERAETALALWTLLSYGFDFFEFSPRLGIVSPEPRCGKTTLLILLEILCDKPLSASSITAAAMFRTIEEVKPTLLIDEADTFLKDNEELRGMINAGHRRNGQAIRLEGRSFKPQGFSCFCPCAIACIGKLPETVKDRSIVVSMRRRTIGERTEPLRMTAAEERYYPVRRKCARFMADNSEAISRILPEMPAGLNDRAMDNWTPLLAIADSVSPELGAKARAAAMALNDCGRDEQSVRVTLLSDIREAFFETGADYMPSLELCDALIAKEDHPWGDWYNGRAMTVYQLARQLIPFGIRPRQRKESSVKTRGYFASDFADAFARYLPGTTVPAAECAALLVPSRGGWTGTASAAETFNGTAVPLSNI